MDPILERYQALEDKVSMYTPNLDTRRLYDAFTFADTAHHGQLRKSGEPYIIHPLAVADIVPCGVIRLTAISLLTGGVLAFVVFLAIWYPARKAARQEPADALRYDG